MASVQGLFITGTDTGVGKTLISCAIVRLLREHGKNAVGFKPVATGEVNGSWGDAEALHEASGRCEPIEKICPVRFALPLAPTMAAAAEHIEPDLTLARSALADLCNRRDTVIVEGVGGLLVPLDKNTLVLDFAAQVGFPVLVVCRAALGTINHTLLTLREIQRSGLKCAGIIMNVTRPQDANMVQGNTHEIERLSGVKVIATMPHLGAENIPDAPQIPLVARAVAHLVRQVNVQTLLGKESATPAGRSGSRPAVR
ncbi:MAG TPA: dethiobiotin synthase [Planctomycetota bacterium]|nr:dethiobiotin synthase [Planctomycetota bacterium]